MTLCILVDVNPHRTSIVQLDEQSAYMYVCVCIYIYIYICINLHKANECTFLYQRNLTIYQNPGCIKDVGSPLLDSEADKATRLWLQAAPTRRTCKMSLITVHIEISCNNNSHSIAVLVCQIRRPIRDSEYFLLLCN